MSVAFVLSSAWSRYACLAAVGCVLLPGVAAAFSASDPSQPSVSTTFSDETVSQSDLRHQLQMQSGAFAAGGGGGWVFVPQLTMEEVFTDNILQTSSNRRWDLITIVSPGITVLGDTPNVQLRLNWSPEGRLAARTPQQDSISNNLLSAGTITVVPDLFYINANAFAGVGPSVGGFGTVGPGLSSQVSQPGVGAFGTAGLAKQNLTQYTSASITPYLLHRFGDYGTGKVGYQYTRSSASNSGSYVPAFFATGSGGQTLTTSQEVAQFRTGDYFAPFRDLVVASATQGNGTGVSQNSAQNIITNNLGYQLNRSISIYGEIGAETLRYGGVPPTNISDIVWGFGTTWTPNPDSQITIGYGHKNGVTGIQLNATYALTARTRINASYNTGLQSDLQQLQGQLDFADLGQNGETIDSQTGAPLFIGNNAIGFQNGLYRSKNFALSATTTLDRDQFSLSVQLQQATTVAAASPVFVGQNSFNPPVGSTLVGNSAFLTWYHQFSEVLSMSSTAAYSTSKVSTSGTQNSIGLTTTLQYSLSETVATFMRYAYFDQMTSSPHQSIYQNLVLVGISKQF